jgi:hypothetical protein
MLQLVQLEEVTWMVMQIHMRWLHCRAGQGRAVLQAIRLRRQLWATKGQVQRRAGQGRAGLYCRPLDYAGSCGPQKGRFSNNSKFTAQPEAQPDTDTHPDDITQCIKSTSLHPQTWFTSSCSSTIPGDCASESVFNNSMAIHVQAYESAYR